REAIAADIYSWPRLSTYKCNSNLKLKFRPITCSGGGVIQSRLAIADTRRGLPTTPIMELRLKCYFPAERPFFTQINV
ncbi:hypothetical protein FA13DRAFT_1890294, partial [Coprinellus micaceus]